MVSTASGDLRYPFARQPAHCLIIDLTSKFDCETLKEVSTGISDFFRLVCAMSSGPSRVPYFALHAMTPYTEIVLPYQLIANAAYSKIEAALLEVQNLLAEGSVQSCDALDSKALEHSMRDATSNFVKVKQNGSLAKLELTVMMRRDRDSIHAGVVQALSNINLTDVTHVSVFSLVTNIERNVDRCSEDSNPGLVDESTQNDSADLNGIVEVFTIDCDRMSVESAMRSWLSDRNIDREHLHLQFSGEPGHELLIKCDVRERLIDVGELPARHCFEIKTSAAELAQQSTQVSSRFSTKQSNPMPIVVLRVVKRVLVSGVCESIVFGKPLLLCSSNCWQMEWDELETNQNHFNALCRSLVESKQALICENVTNASAKKRPSQAEAPSGLFLLLASKNLNSILLKSISCRELLLTTQVPLQPQWEVVTKSAIDDVERVINAVEYEAEFNPLLSRSRLIEFLKALNLRDSSEHRRETCKRLPNRSGTSVNSARHVNPTPPPRAASYKKENVRPATGRAARFVAPRPKDSQLQYSCPETIQDINVPTISLSRKERPLKKVTFPDFTNF